MSKAVMISIKPKWVELIASGQKTVEVRKTRPKIDVPFKCYIYETQGKKWKNKNEPQMQEGKGRVAGEFVCDRIYDINYILDNEEGYCGFNTDYPYGADCLTVDELEKYLVSRLWVPYSQSIVVGYGWHISNLKMYDKPKALSEFNRYVGFLQSDKITKAPQSWMYVEELQ